MANDDADFYELVKYVDAEPEISEDRLNEFLEQGMWPDKPSEHVGFFSSEEKAEEQRELMKESSKKHRDKMDSGGWFAVVRERTFMDSEEPDY